METVLVVEKLLNIIDMKNMSLLFLLLFILSGCNDHENNRQQNPPSIYGIWQLIESYSDPGRTGEGKWIKTNDEYSYEILINGTFNSTKYNECSTGLYSISKEKKTISFTFSCDDFDPCEASSVLCNESFSFDNQYLILIPNYLQCDEGCAHKFEKIAEPESAG